MWVMIVDGQGEMWSAEPLDGKTTDAFQGEVWLHRLEAPLLFVEGSL